MAAIKEVVAKALKMHGADSTNMLDIIRTVQNELGCVSDEACKEIAKRLGVSVGDVSGVVSFYHFFTKTPRGKYTVYLNNSAVSMMKGMAGVAKAFESAAGCRVGQTTADGLIGLYYTSDIGMNDQEPAALINGVVFTSLTPDRARELVSQMKAGKKVEDMVKTFGDGQNASSLIRSMVKNNIQKKGPVIFAPFTSGSALAKAVAMTPEQVIEEVKKSNLRGRGGAGFPTGMKWEFTRKNRKKKTYVVCNADEGEPGTFKDRVILTEMPQLLFEGMAIAGYAIGAEQGVLYLRYEYSYLKNYLENVLDSLRKSGVLGKNIAGKKGFNFDITIKLGAGAYVCGEESALIESAEGKRGEPRNRPPFPAQYGLYGQPTAVNNVETLCAAARILLNGGEWFAKMGTFQSHGTKVLSVSGDCMKPGVYEVEFGMILSDFLSECGGTDARAVQIGGPSGKCIGRRDFGKKISFEELPTGGSIIIIGPNRDLLEIVHNFMEFFVEESCGWCTPCRAGNKIILNRLEKIMHGNGTASDLKELTEWCGIVKAMSRCGLGQTSPNPVVTTIENFRDVYEAKLRKNLDYFSEFDLAKSVKEYCDMSGRKPHIEGH